MAEIDKYLCKLLAENIALSAKLSALQGVVFGFLKAYYPDAEKQISNNFQKQQQLEIENHLLSDPFLEDVWKQFLSELPFDGNQGKPHDTP